MTLLRAVLPTAEEQHELLRLNAEFQSVQTAAHDSSQERDVCKRILLAQGKIAKAHGLGSLYGGMGFSRLKDGSWAVGPLTYPLTPGEEHQVRGLG
jgi:hypothetical protein